MLTFDTRHNVLFCFFSGCLIEGVCLPFGEYKNDIETCKKTTCLQKGNGYTFNTTLYGKNCLNQFKTKITVLLFLHWLLCLYLCESHKSVSVEVY